MSTLKKYRKKIAPIVRNSRFLNAFPRLYLASQYYNKKYLQIGKWLVTSREDTNYTYALTDENMQYLAAMISVITGTAHHDVYTYMIEAQEDQALREYLLQKIRGSRFRSVADERADFARRLGWYAFVRILKPKVIVETGVDKGHGAVLLCAALKRNKAEGFDGRYFGTDINPHAGYLLDGEYAQYGEILYGDSVESIEKFDQQIDIFINDSDHSADYEYREYQAVKDKLSENAILIGDNAHVTDKLFLFAQETGRKFLFHHEVPKDHWYPGSGLGVAFR